jgi:hypothetical protein
MITWKCLQYALVCFLGSHISKWLVEGYLYPPHTIVAVGQKQQLSVDGCTGQSGAHRTIIVHCPVPCHVSRPLGSIAVDRWIRPLPRLSGATTRECPVWASLRKLPGVNRTVRCTPDRLLFTVGCTTSALADCPLHSFLRCFFWASFPIESWTSTHLLCLLLMCCILSVLVQSFSHLVNYKHRH